MLAPPSQGSEIVDKLRWFRPLMWLLGPAFLQLGTDESSIPLELEAPEYETIVIMGNQSIDPLGSWLIPGSDDGRVSVSRAKIPSHRHFKLMPVNHAFIMQDQKVIKEVIQLLKSDTR